MKLNTALKFILSILFFCLPVYVYAQTYVPVYDDTVTINSTIEEDLFSEVTVSPESVEVREPSVVTVRIVSSDGTPIANREIVLYGEGLNIVQPVSLTNSNGVTTGSVSSNISGTYEVCARDTTYDFDIDIHDCAVLYVMPLETPVMFPEPYYTKGLINNILWESMGEGYQYTVQASTSDTFSSIYAQAVWIEGTSHEFVNLENEQIYFYRVRARNLYGGVSNWSNSVFSVQDDESPTIEILEIGDIGENTTTDWNNADTFTIKTITKDNLKLHTVHFFCVNRDGTTEECGTVSNSGDNYDISVRLDELERNQGVYLFTNYEFCIEARDEAGNVNRYCDISIAVPEGEPSEPGEPSTPSTPTVIDRIEKSIDDITTVVDDVVGEIPQNDLQTITSTASVVTVATAFTFLASSLWEIPYVIFQMFLTFISWFGFRKRGSRLGYVYNSITKEPVAQAIVRIFDEEGHMVWSDVTDHDGNFNAELESGKYRVSVRKGDFEFPSDVVFGKEDYPLTGVYHGEFFNFDSNFSGSINFSIPIDPLEVSKLRLFMNGIWGRLKFVFSILHIFLFIVGLVLSLYAYSRNDSWYNFFIILLFIPSFFLLVQNLFSRRVKYGVVRDIDGNPLENIGVALREVEFEKIIAKRVTNVDGKYRFFVDDGRYQVEILETNYKINSVEEGLVVDTERDNTLVARDIVLEEY